MSEITLHTRIARSVEAIRRSFVDHFFYLTGTTLENANISTTTRRSRMRFATACWRRWSCKVSSISARGTKTVAYLLAEFLTGPHLANNILNLKLGDRVHEAIRHSRRSHRTALALAERLR